MGKFGERTWWSDEILGASGVLFDLLIHLKHDGILRRNAISEHGADGDMENGVSEKRSR